MAEEFNLDGMVDIYIYENGQLLENLEEIVLETKDDDAFDENSINEIFRIMHTIKGSSGVMMYDNIMKVSHKLEDIFYYLRENIGIEEPHMELTEIVFQVLDFINGEMEKIKDGNDPDGVKGRTRTGSEGRACQNGRGNGTGTESVLYSATGVRSGKMFPH